MEAYSTRTVHKKERVDYWQDLCSRTYADLKLSPRDHRNFEGELRRSFAGPLSFVKVSSSAACIDRSEEHVTHSSDHRFDIFLTLRGESPHEPPLGGQPTARRFLPSWLRPLLPASIRRPSSRMAAVCTLPL